MFWESFCESAVRFSQLISQKNVQGINGKANGSQRYLDDKEVTVFLVTRLMCLVLKRLGSLAKLFGWSSRGFCTFVRRLRLVGRIRVARACEFLSACCAFGKREMRLDRDILEGANTQQTLENQPERGSYWPGFPTLLS